MGILDFFKGINAEEKLRKEALKTLNCVISPAMRAKVDNNRDVAWLISDQILDMAKSGKIDEQLICMMPSDIVERIRDFVKHCAHSSLSKNEVAHVLEKAQNEFLDSFTN